MSMNLKQISKNVESSKAFKSFIKAHPDYFLAHCFSMLVEGEGEKDIKWELGYYSEKTDKVVVFETEPKINMRPEEDAFKKDGTIKKLDIGKIKLNISKTLKICDEVVDKKYPNRSITKKIIILQNLDKQIYNITLVTISFDILNIRIDAATGEVLSDNIQSIMGLGRKDLPPSA
jgi:uncharacterized membrane protein YkoI